MSQFPRFQGTHPTKAKINVLANKQAKQWKQLK